MPPRPLLARRETPRCESLTGQSVCDSKGTRLLFLDFHNSFIFCFTSKLIFDNLVTLMTC